MDYYRRREKGLNIITDMIEKKKYDLDTINQVVEDTYSLSASFVNKRINLLVRNNKIIIDKNGIIRPKK